MIVPDVVFEDNDIIIVNKPSGWLTIPDRYNNALNNVVGYLKKEREEVWVVHRIDRETSGILIFAKNQAAHQHLSQQFMDRTTEKYYLALADGIPMEESGDINQPLTESKAEPGKMVVSSKGRKAHSQYEVLERFKNFSWLSVRIFTGKMHQIRVHLKFIGHPLAVDSLYGNREKLDISDIKKRKVNLGKWVEEAHPLITRITLHAAKLVLDHPTTHERITFEAPLPKDLRAVLQQLRKWSQ